MAKTKFTLLIPLHYNDGTKIPEAERDRVYNQVYSFADGYTLAGTVTGAYRMRDGSKKVDHSTVLWIAIDESQEPELRQLASAICSQLKQEAIYVERSGGTVEFVLPPVSGDDP